MKKSKYWLLFALASIGINLGTIPITMFALFDPLFDTLTGTNIFSIDYLIAFAIFLIPNIVTIGLFILAKKEAMIEFFLCLGLAVVEVTALAFVFFTTFEYVMIFVLIVGLCTVGAAILVVKSIIRPSVKPL